MYGEVGLPALSLTLVAFVLLSSAAMTRPQAADEADRLYANREHLPSAERAAALWEARMAGSRSDYDAAWKLGRAPLDLEWAPEDREFKAKAATLLDTLRTPR